MRFKANNLCLEIARISAGIFGLLGASVIMANHSWGPYHWERSSNPVYLELGDNLSGSWGTHLVNASADWNQSGVLDLGIIGGSPKNLRRCAPQTGNIEICNDSYGNNGWLGIASITIAGDHITSASVRVNDFYFSLPTYDTSDWRRFVMCQEVGHVFGLGHQDEDFDNADLRSCMDYTNNPQNNLTPNQHDYAQLDFIYSHSDSASGGVEPDSDGSGPPSCKGGPKKCGSRGIAGLRDDVDPDDPSQWGRLVSEHGPQETFELDLGQGRKIITHVLWTIESAENRHSH